MFEGYFEEQSSLVDGTKFRPLWVYENQAVNQIKKLRNFFLEVYVTQVGVKPFGEALEGQVISFDTKLNFEDNSRYL